MMADASPSYRLTQQPRQRQGVPNGRRADSVGTASVLIALLAGVSLSTQGCSLIPSGVGTASGTSCAGIDLESGKVASAKIGETMSVKCDEGYNYSGPELECLVLDRLCAKTRGRTMCTKATGFGPHGSGWKLSKDSDSDDSKSGSGDSSGDSKGSGDGSSGDTKSSPAPAPDSDSGDSKSGSGDSSGDSKGSDDSKDPKDAATPEQDSAKKDSTQFRTVVPKSPKDDHPSEDVSAEIRSLEDVVLKPSSKVLAQKAQAANKNQLKKMLKCTKPDSAKSSRASVQEKFSSTDDVGKRLQDMSRTWTLSMISLAAVGLLALMIALKARTQHAGSQAEAEEPLE